jgi:hypothetical protein
MVYIAAWAAAGSGASADATARIAASLAAATAIGIATNPSVAVVGVVHIGGYTRGSTGAALGNCVVKLYRTSDDALVGQTVSAVNGSYSIAAVSGVEHYMVAYLDGSPDVAGTTVNYLVGT